MKKVMHFYWGNDEMSYMRYMTLYSFCKLNPDWEVCLIENKLANKRVLAGMVEKQDKTEFTGRDYSHYVDELNINRVAFTPSMLDLPTEVVYTMSDVHIKDILNWKILSEGAGAVADMDILFIKALTPAIEEDTDIGLICFRGYPQQDYIPVSFMYAANPTRFFDSTYKRALKLYTPSVYESCGTLCIEEPNLESIKDKYPETKIQQLADEIVFPYTKFPWGEGIKMLYQGDNSSKLHPNAVGIHWYGGAPLSQRNNNQINATNLNFLNNTMTKQIKEVLCQSPSNL